jgi:hypothetical protein
MEFLAGVVLFIAGSIAVAVCLTAIPGPAGAAGASPPAAHGHGAH